ncbi:TetR/AcrR family transcriptional regulator [Mycobacterium sp. RTGN3]|uniref:TetR/AcrR family transcriptional regulator n=1 Tax=unclassified Mycobacterium TaxID=2642494 RepID=UPI0039B00156
MTPRPSQATKAVPERTGQPGDDDGTRRAEVLETAASLIATSGLRTSMHDIASAAGIQTGSLYHHFASKEALMVELLRRYHTDLDRVAERGMDVLDDPATRPGFAQIAALGTAIARSATAHSAALQLSIYETPSSNPELNEWTRRRPTAILDAMYQTLRAARWAGYVRSDVDLAVLADRVTQTMLQVGLDIMRHRAPTDQVATLLCRIMLEGLATGRPTDAELDQSAAFRAADEVIGNWVDDPVDGDDKTAHIRAVARAEFGRRGYEGTTVRDIAAAAGVGHGTVFRLIRSKDELLVSIMQSFGDKVEAGSQAVFRSNSSVVEKLDALSWVNTNALNRFGDEFRIQLAWLRQIPPDAPNPSMQFPQRLKQTKSLLAKGIRAGELKIDDAPGEMLARCAIGLKWIPENILRDIGTRKSLLHIRDTVLRGVVAPSG